MKIREILDLTQEQRLSEIAKEHLSIGEKAVREALKNAGCYSLAGRKGWYFDGSDEILDRSIYDFSTVKPKANVRTKKESKEKIKEEKNENTKVVTNVNINEGVVKRKRASFDIDEDLFKRLKVKAVLEERNIYELVEEALKEYLNNRLHEN